MNQIGAILNKKIKTPWGMGLDDKLLSGDGTQYRIAALSAEFKKVENQVNTACKELQQKKLSRESNKVFAAINKEIDQLSTLKQANPVAWLVGSMRIMEKLRDLQWRVKLEEKYQ